MKIDPDPVQLPQPVTAPAQSAAPIPGEPSLFERMLGNAGLAVPSLLADPPASPGEAPMSSNGSRPGLGAGMPPSVTMSSAGVSASFEAEGPSHAAAKPVPDGEARGSVAFPPEDQGDLPPPLPTTSQPDRLGTMPREKHRAFGFGELGIWGHAGPHGPVPRRTCAVLPDGGGKRTLENILDNQGSWPGLPILPARDGADRPRFGGMAGSVEADQSGLLAAKMVGLAGRSLSNEATSTQASSPVASGDLTIQASSIEAPADEAAIDGAAPADAPDAPPPQSDATALNVLVSEGVGGLQITAALPDISPEAVLRLRRVAESLVREFGLSVAEFTLNGAAIGAAAGPDRSTQWR